MGSRSYAFNGVATIGLSQGAGNDTTSTSFFTFVQNLAGGGGENQLLVDGTKVVTSPLVKIGYGTITTFGFVTAPPPPPPPPSTFVPTLTNVFLQNFTPANGSNNSAGSSQTNNFNSTSTSGVSGLSGLGAQSVAGSVAATGGFVSNSLSALASNGFGSMGGGGPASLALQSLMNSNMSATVERELNMSLGGDGTIRLQNGGGLFAIDPTIGAPSAASTTQLDMGISLLAQSELSIGAIGRGEVPLTVQAGAQPITMGDPLPSLNVQQYLIRVSTPEAFSAMFLALGGDGTARLEYLSGSITMEVNGKPVSSKVENALRASISAGSFGELSRALGGMGEYLITESSGLAVMDGAGAATPPDVKTQLYAVLAPHGARELSLALGEDGSAMVLTWDGIANTDLYGVPPGPFVILKLDNALTPECMEELDHATR